MFFMLLLALLYGSINVSCYYSLHITSSKSVLMEGENLTMICDVNIRHTNQSFFIVWIKYMPLEYGLGSNEVEIGTNEHINSVFSSTGRYSSWYQLKDPRDFTKVKFYLHIAKIQSGDAGKIGCKVPNQIDVLKAINVIVPVRTMQLLSHDVSHSQTSVFEDRQLVEVKEGEIRRITCNILGAYPEPDVRVTVAGRDVTYNFITTSSLVRSGSTPGLVNANYMVSVKSLNFEFEYGMDGGELVCSASTPYFSITESIAITIALTGFRPRFSCPRVVQVNMYENNVALSCRVRSMPPPIFARVYWTKRTKEVVQMLPDEMNTPYTFTVVDKMFELRLAKVFPQMLRSYFFEAKNEYGSSIHQVDLIQTSSLRVQALTSMATAIQLSNLLLLLIIRWHLIEIF